MKFTNLTQLAGLVAALIAGVEGHSWIDELRVIDGIKPERNQKPPVSKLKTPPPPDVGYIRNYPDERNDLALTYSIINTIEGAFACKENQRGLMAQNIERPRLRVAPGSKVEATYTENGHISKPDNTQQQPGKISLYGIEQEKYDEKLMLKDMLTWKAKGEESNVKGILLQPSGSFDDGTCVEDNDTAISTKRKGGGKARACRATFVVPMNVKIGSFYTVIWYWDFDLHHPTPGRIERYTSCATLEVVPPEGGVKKEEKKEEKKEDKKPKVRVRRSSPARLVDNI